MRYLRCTVSLISARNGAAIESASTFCPSGMSARSIAISAQLVDAVVV
jgi:hypothetical protein